MNTKIIDPTSFVRGIQLSEGNYDCFRRAVGGCDQKRCAWYEYCVNNRPLPDSHLAILYTWMLTDK